MTEHDDSVDLRVQGGGNDSVSGLNTGSIKMPFNPAGKRGVVQVLAGKWKGGAQESGVSADVWRLLGGYMGLDVGRKT